MKKISDFIVKNHLLIVFISLILLVPAIIGSLNTRVNYDILIYLPEEVETIKGQNILKDDFHIGSYAFVMIENESAKNILKLEDKIRKIESVDKVVSLVDVIGTTIPSEMLPDEIADKLYKDNETVIMVTFTGSTSEDSTINAIKELRRVVGDAKNVSSMTSMVVDTMELSDSEMVSYIIIAVILCLIVLIIATDSYIVPVLLLSNIGIAILYNLGTNIFLGQISYITKAITAVLQLGVTTDFSIFLYHKYEQAKESNTFKNNKQAMKFAILETFKSVLGSSLTTFAGFLALCTMDLTLGTDIGIVMAKGVLFGVICVLTLFPALLLTFDKLIQKTRHKQLLPNFNKLSSFSIKRYKLIAILFIILLVPALIGNSNYQVYYKLDESLPKDLAFQVSNSKLAEKYNIVSPEIALLDNNIKKYELEELVNEIENIDGIEMVLPVNALVDSEVLELLPEDLIDTLDNSKYQLMIINSKYSIASDKLNNQISKVNKILKKYDNNAIVAGEGPLMKDLVTIADHDFQMVNYTSIIVIFIIMLFVLKSFGLPIILILAIEFAIFTNMAFAYYMGEALPFIASIVVGTIQLGATIDYAILMSTKYLDERINYDKKKAMENTLNVTIPSIITSALCFFAATFGVAVFTKIDMIGAICKLLARGSIISMLVVIFILPTLLMIFDKFILKTTKINKEV